MNSSNCSNKIVFVSQSKILNAGLGLFANRNLLKNELICFYSGKLVDCAEVKFIDPTYVVEFELGKGFKLVGDNEDNDSGIYANSVHPNQTEIRQNARFQLQSKKIINGGRGRFEVRAIRDIAAGDEIIVNYGSSYWRSLEKWHQGIIPKRSSQMIERDERASKRIMRFKQI